MDFTVVSTTDQAWDEEKALFIHSALHCDYSQFSGRVQPLSHRDEHYITCRDHQTLQAGNKSEGKKALLKMVKTETRRDRSAAHQLFVVAVCGPAQATACVTAHSFCSLILAGALCQAWLFLFSL